MKKFILYITLLMMPVLCSAKKAFVIEKDRTIIVTGEQPSPSVILAAHELQHFIKQSLDIHLPIVSEVPQQPSKIIFVGGSKYTEKVRFKEQEYLIEITPETITLMGQDENFDTTADVTITVSLLRKTGRKSITPNPLVIRQLLPNSPFRLFMMHRAPAMPCMTSWRTTWVSVSTVPIH